MHPGLWRGAAGVASDQEDADVYAHVADVSRRELNVRGQLYLHPYLAVATDNTGATATDPTTFEYEPSNALELLQQHDSTLALCQYNAQGMCANNYIVFSQIARVSERDAIVVVRSMRGAGGMRVLVVRLRYRSGRWRVSGSELMI